MGFHSCAQPGCGAQEVLVNPEHGYYVSREAIGKEGDFTTSPEVSQLMGEVRPRRCLRPATLRHNSLPCCTPSPCPPQQAVAQMVGVWAAAAWQAAGSPARVRLVELGPGRGTLMADLLRGTSSLRAFAAAVEVDLVEARQPDVPLARLLLCFCTGRGAHCAMAGRAVGPPQGAARAGERSAARAPVARAALRRRPPACCGARDGSQRAVWVQGGTCSAAESTCTVLRARRACSHQGAVAGAGQLAPRAGRGPGRLPHLLHRARVPGRAAGAKPARWRAGLSAPAHL